MALGISGIDEKSILSLYEGDLGIYLPVLHAYVEELPAALDKLRKVSAETLREYAVAIHGVKGTSASACAEDARITAFELEKLAKAGDIAGVLARNTAFLRYMENLAAGIRNWFQKTGK